MTSDKHATQKARLIAGFVRAMTYLTRRHWKIVLLEVLLFSFLFVLSAAVIQSGYGGHGGGSPFFINYDQGWPFVAFHREKTLPFDSASGFFGLLQRYSGIHAVDALPLLCNALVILAVSSALIFIGLRIYAFARKPQFSILSLSLVLLAASLVCSAWACCAYRRAEDQQVADSLVEMGWSVREDPNAILPKWIYVLMDNLHIPSPDCACRITSIVWRRPRDEKANIKFADHSWKDVNAMLCGIEPQMESLRYCKSVSVWDSGLTDEGVVAICRSLCACDVVDFATCSRISDNSAESIAKAWPGLESLRLENARLSEKGMQHVTSLVGLRYLSLVGKCNAVAPPIRIEVARLPYLEVLEYPPDWEHTPGLLKILEERDIMHGSLIEERFDEPLPASPEEEMPFD